MCKKLGIKSKLSTAFHPQTDGQTERANQDIETYLRIYCGDHPETWADHLAPLEFAYNATKHSATKQSPFSLLYGYEPIAIPEIELNNDAPPAANDRLTLLQTKRKEALGALELSRSILTRLNLRNFQPFNPGQRVWLEATNLNTPNRSVKLSPKREGPFTIKTKLSDFVYELNLPKRWKVHPVFNAALLSPYKETPEHGPTFSQPPPEIVEGEEEYEIEAILSHRNKANRRQYLVKWKGYADSENQWLTKAQLQNAPEILSKYHSTHKL